MGKRETDGCWVVIKATDPHCASDAYSHGETTERMPTSVSTGFFLRLLGRVESVSRVLLTRTETATGVSYWPTNSL